MIIDSHAHLESLEDLEEKITRAKDQKITNIVSISSSVNSSKNTIGIAENYDMVYSSVGIHPHNADQFNDQSINELEKLSKNSKVVAIGETGLDYHYLNSTKEIQIRCFKSHLNLSKKLSLPVIIHVRESDTDLINSIKEESFPGDLGIIHCFSGNYETAKIYLELGFYISFSGIVTFKKAEELRETASKLPIDRILVETDSPYLAPVPYRGKPNEPCNVRYVVEKIAEIRNISFEKAAQQTAENAIRLFKIPNH